MERLKKCPFCGGEARIEQIPSETWDKFVVTCKSPKCCAYYIGYCDEGLYDTRLRAIAAWNTRKLIENAVERMEVIADNSSDLISVMDNPQYYDGYEDGMIKAIEIIKEELN